MPRQSPLLTKKSKQVLPQKQPLLGRGKFVDTDNQSYCNAPENTGSIFHSKDISACAISNLKQSQTAAHGALYNKLILNHSSTLIQQKYAEISREKVIKTQKKLFRKIARVSQSRP